MLIMRGSHLCQSMTPKHTPLLPQEAYFEDAHALSARLRKLGWLCGLCMTSIFLVMYLDDLRGRRWTEARVLANFCAPLGLFIAIVTWSVWRRNSSLRQIGRVFAGDPKIIGNAPSPDEYPFCLPCLLIVGIGRPPPAGVLYVGRARARFVPHLKFRREDLALEPLLETPAALDVWPPFPSELFRFLFQIPKHVVVAIRTGSGTYRFWMPTPSLVVPLINNAASATHPTARESGGTG